MLNRRILRIKAFKIIYSYAVTGGQGDGVGGVQNAIRRIQADLSKDVYKVMPYEVSMSIKIQDQLRGAVTSRSIEDMYNTGIRLDYDKYMDINTYKGQSAYGTTGLLNDPNIVAASVAAGASGKTTWKDKTPPGNPERHRRCHHRCLGSSAV